jgi:hypothetical protein
MLVVIGVSTTVEYFFKGWYEHTFGTLSYWISGRVQEDDYAASVASNYVTFIKKEPWFMFDFWGAFKGLWNHNAMIGHGMFRKFERKYLLSTEYLTKALYGKIIAWGSHSVYGVESENTAVLITPRLASLPNTMHYVTKGSLAIVLAPRLDDFYPAATQLALAGAKFEEIAGNDSFISFSLIQNDDWINPCHQADLIYRQTILTKESQSRFVMISSVSDLSDALLCFHRHHIVLEHVFDY